MKKSKLLFEEFPFSKKGVLPFLLTFLFFAIMQFDMTGQTFHNGNSQAQPPSKVMFQMPTGNFVSVPVAQDRLLAAMTALKHQLTQFAEGTAPYDAAYRRYIYYNEIYVNLEHGVSVAEAIVKSLSRILVAADPPFLATPEEAIVEKNAATTLLRL